MGVKQTMCTEEEEIGGGDEWRELQKEERRTKETTQVGFSCV